MRVHLGFCNPVADADAVAVSNIEPERSVGRLPASALDADSLGNDNIPRRHYFVAPFQPECLAVGQELLVERFLGDVHGEAELARAIAEFEKLQLATGVLPFSAAQLAHQVDSHQGYGTAQEHGGTVALARDVEAVVDPVRDVNVCRARVHKHGLVAFGATAAIRVRRTVFGAQVALGLDDFALEESVVRKSSHQNFAQEASCEFLAADAEELAVETRRRPEVVPEARHFGDREGLPLRRRWLVLHVVTDVVFAWSLGRLRPRCGRRSVTIHSESNTQR